MPPRKSDSSRRNDVAMAKFVLNDPEGPVPAAAAGVPLLAPSPAPAPMRPGSTPAADPVEMDTDRPRESAPPSDRRSDKDGRDTVAIEVREHTHRPPGRTAGRERTAMASRVWHTPQADGPYG